MSAEIVVPVPAWVAENLAEVAGLCGKSTDYVASSFFAAEVVHTRKAKDASFCRRGGTHPTERQRK